jgi:hypothetical protein
VTTTAEATQRALCGAAVDQRAGRRLDENARQRRHRHHHADRGLVPLLFGQKVDRKIRAEAVPHIGEKEVQRIQRAPDALSGLLQARNLMRS